MSPTYGSYHDVCASSCDQSGETAEWQRAENALTDEFVREWPHFARLRELVGHYVADGNGSLNWMFTSPGGLPAGSGFSSTGPGPNTPSKQWSPCPGGSAVMHACSTTRTPPGTCRAARSAAPLRSNALVGMHAH
jgi:hypothetical protein